jgi:predicted transporter
MLPIFPIGFRSKSDQWWLNGKFIFGVRLGWGVGRCGLVVKQYYQVAGDFIFGRDQLINMLNKNTIVIVKLCLLKSALIIVILYLYIYLYLSHKDNYES